MKRRHVWAAAVSVVAAPRWAGAAAAAGARSFRLGVLGFTGGATQSTQWDALIAELAKQGFVVGRNLTIEPRTTRTDKLDAAASALAALQVDAIYAADGTQTALAAKRATSSIPIVFTSSDPVAFGLVSSLARPGANLTGVSIQGPAITSKEMEALLELLGSLRTVAYIHPVGARSLPWYASYVGAATSAAKTLGVQIEFHEIAGMAAYEPLIGELARRKVDAVGSMPGTAAMTLTAQDHEWLAALLVRHRLPSMGPARYGFLLNCEFAAALMGQRLGYLVGRVLRGTRPAELPVEEFSALQLILNAKTARSLGLTIPPSLLLRAEEVIP